MLSLSYSASGLLLLLLVALVVVSASVVCTRSRRGSHTPAHTHTPSHAHSVKAHAHAHAHASTLYSASCCSNESLLLPSKAALGVTLTKHLLSASTCGRLIRRHRDRVLANYRPEFGSASLYVDP